MGIVTHYIFVFVIVEVEKIETLVCKILCTYY